MKPNAPAAHDISPRAMGAGGPVPVRIEIFRWAGKWGPFKIKTPCGECALTLDVVRDTLRHDLEGVPAEVEVREWLSEWWRPLELFPLRGWHAPIVRVEGEIVSEGEALNRGVLTQKVIAAHAAKTPIEGVHLFGKETCPHCLRAKGYFDRAGIAYTYHDVVREPRALYEMLARVKPLVSHSTPITVPQIWIDGDYIGGADQLAKRLGMVVEPNPERGQNSLAPHSLVRA